MQKMNCWEFKMCGRQAGGSHVHDLGVCPVSIESKLDGIHDGRNGGRACWVVAGTYCGGEVQGTFAAKYHNCEKCDFYRLIRLEEGARYTLSIVLLKKLEDARQLMTSGQDRVKSELGGVNE